MRTLHVPTATGHGFVYLERVVYLYIMPGALFVTGYWSWRWKQERCVGNTHIFNAQRVLSTHLHSH